MLNKELKKKIKDARQSLNDYEDSDEKININLTLKLMHGDLNKTYTRVDKIEERVKELNERITKLRKRDRK